ncbi:hypothetical protein NQ314_017993 [Rhamnusium bicolor]|uniref:Ribosomal protein S19 n=1 Tax=Rhamnusium bicolor TaxID=1586634 RepID=A0AAV8WS04_9CUCU|nr:hypothetical protein NQ314_017993 [Rhamnusium bicolor]
MQDKRKEIADKGRRVNYFHVGSKVLVKTHVISSNQRGFTSKFVPHLVTEVVTPNSYILTICHEPMRIIGIYHGSDLLPHSGLEMPDAPIPMVPKRKRG